MGRVVLDSSYVIALLRPEDQHHERARKKLVMGNGYLLSAISLTETFVYAQRIGIMESQLRALKKILSDVVEVSEEIALEAARIRAKTLIKTPDAIISATATSMSAQLWTFDLALAKAHKGAVLIK